MKFVRNTNVFVLFYVLVVSSTIISAKPATFEQDFKVTWADSHLKPIEGGKTIQLKLDQSSGKNVTPNFYFIFLIYAL